MKRIVVFAFLLLSAAIASACLWDYDTFAVEAAGKDDLVAVLSGRFERNPPLYYEMRLEHSLQVVKAEPDNLDEYDNAAVAAERLGRHDLALDIIGRKRGRLRPLPLDKDHWYRYYANLGTFHAHRSFSQKTRAARQSDLDQAEIEIAKAIEINPEAHFGREKYQLYAIRWLRNPDKESPLFSDYLLEADPNGMRDASAVRGLAGLIRLGNAWESVDVWAALAAALAHKEDHDSSLAGLAMARVRELLKQGKKSSSGLARDDFLDRSESMLVWQQENQIVKQNEGIFKRLRSEADLWQRNRTRFMLARLKAGRHPDWDKTFWTGWDDEPKLSVPEATWWQTRSSASQQIMTLAAALLGCCALPIAILVGLRSIWRRVR